MPSVLREFITNQGGVLRVKGQSMWPVCPNGSFLEFLPVKNLESLKPGDLVVVALSQHFRIHRLVASPQGGYLRTAGDCLLKADHPTPVRNLIGKVKLPKKSLAFHLNKLFSLFTVWRFGLTRASSSTVGIATLSKA